MSPQAALAVALGACWLLVQLGAVPYGTWINDLPHLQQAIEPTETSASQLERDALVSAGNELAETPATWLLRYKLYAVTADEMVNLMSLSRLRPEQLAFDPHFYMYGGAYLYPLAAWYGIGYGAGLLPLPTITTLLEQPTVVDHLYIWGRIFVLLAVATSAAVFYQTVRLVQPQASSALLVLYLAVPGSLQFSIAMKPHWYALLWATLALHVVVKLFVVKLPPAPRQLILLAVSLGLAVGSSTAYALWAVILYGALLMAWQKKIITTRWLITIPVLAGIVFFLTNPYVLVNYDAYQAEGAALWGWYTLRGSGSAVVAFIKNSLLAGFGLPALLALGAAVRELVHPRSGLRTGAASAIIGITIFAGIVTSTVSDWNNAYRFIPYYLPLALVYLAVVYSPRVLAATAVATVLLAVPTVTAYYDESDPAHSTRQQAAAWVSAHLPPGTTLCTPMVPYNSVPFDFTQYTITPTCRYRITVHPHTTAAPSTEALVAEFTPRWYSRHYPLVYGEVQPRVTITKTP